MEIQEIYGILSFLVIRIIFATIFLYTLHHLF